MYYAVSLYPVLHIQVGEILFSFLSIFQDVACGISHAWWTVYPLLIQPPICQNIIVEVHM